jgi:hypothetical protein
VGKQRDYAQKLLNESIESASSVVTFTKEELKASVGIPLGDGGLILKAANEMLQIPPFAGAEESNVRFLPLSSPTKRAIGSLPPLKPPLATYMFCSHNWGTPESKFDNHVRVGAVVDCFQKQHGKPVWFDNERLDRNICAQVTSGVETSAVFVAFITLDYKEKVENGAKSKKMDWCFEEFDHALNHKRSMMIPVVMEERMMKDQSLWTGPVGRLASGIYIDFISDDKLDSCVRQLALRVAQLMGQA